MIRNSGLRRYRKSAGEESANPMDGIANMSDVMLVLACGLMMAIIMFWNVDLKATVKTVEEQEITDSEKVQMIDDEGNVKGEYESKGRVYEDPETGKLYMVVPKDE